MKKTYSIGDQVWVARASLADVWEPCPVCFGNLKVTLILGNDEQVMLPCTYCSPGYSPPQGFIKEVVYSSGAELRTITGVESNQTAEGTKIGYRSDCYILYPENCFDTQEEALEKGKELAAAQQEEWNTRAEHIKADAKKKFSWNAGYHLREAKRKEKEAARHRELAVLCKTRSKEDET